MDQVRGDWLPKIRDEAPVRSKADGQNSESAGPRTADTEPLDETEETKMETSRDVDESDPDETTPVQDEVGTPDEKDASIED